jgi:hypothetical protein
VTVEGAASSTRSSSLCTSASLALATCPLCLDDSGRVASAKIVKTSGGGLRRAADEEMPRAWASTGGE